MRFSKALKSALFVVLCYLAAVTSLLLALALLAYPAQADDGRLAPASSGSARITLIIQPVVRINSENETEAQKILTNLPSDSFTLETLIQQGFQPVVIVQSSAD